MPQYIVGSHIFFRRELYMECRKNIQRGSAFLRLGIIWGRVSARKKEALQSSQIFFNNICDWAELLGKSGRNGRNHQKIIFWVFTKGSVCERNPV